jgi:hypothetical protein
MFEATATSIWSVRRHGGWNKAYRAMKARFDAVATRAYCDPERRLRPGRRVPAPGACGDLLRAVRTLYLAASAQQDATMHRWLV